MRWRERLVMTSGARYAVVFLFMLSVAIGVAAYFAAVTYYHRSQASQQRQAQQVEHKLCTSLTPLEPLAGLKAPAGNPAANPSRAFEQRLNRLLQPLAQLGPDIGCKRR